MQKFGGGIITWDNNKKSKSKKKHMEITSSISQRKGNNDA